MWPAHERLMHQLKCVFSTLHHITTLKWKSGVWKWKVNHPSVINPAVMSLCTTETHHAPACITKTVNHPLFKYIDIISQNWDNVLRIVKQLSQNSYREFFMWTKHICGTDESRLKQFEQELLVMTSNLVRAESLPMMDAIGWPAHVMRCLGVLRGLGVKHHLLSVVYNTQYWILCSL